MVSRAPHKETSAFGAGADETPVRWISAGLGPHPTSATEDIRPGFVFNHDRVSYIWLLGVNARSVANWEAIGAIGEILGALAVVATLGYLAGQIRQNTRASQASAHQSLTEAAATMNAMVARDSEVARLWSVAFEGGLASLEEGDRVRFNFIVGQWFLAFESVYIQHELETLQEDFFSAKMENLKNMLKGPGVREAWKRSEKEYTLGFREYVGQNLLIDDA